MKKYLYFAIILFIISLLPILRVEASENVNLTKNIKDTSGNSLPALNLIPDFCYTYRYNASSSNTIMYWDYSYKTEGENFYFIIEGGPNDSFKYRLFYLVDNVYRTISGNKDTSYSWSNLYLHKDYNFKISYRDDSLDEFMSIERKYYYLTQTNQYIYGTKESTGTETRDIMLNSFVIFDWYEDSENWENFYAIKTNQNIWLHNASNEEYINDTVINMYNKLLYSSRNIDFYNGSEVIYTYNPVSLPTYLSGYKEIVLTTENKYIMSSSIKKGSVYIPYEAFNKYGGRLSYFDKELKSQPYSSVIQNYTIMEDYKFVRQDFDLSSYEGADFMLFNKYLYLEGKDNISYSIWVPEESYNSEVEIKPNPSGGSDFTYNYKDENGEEQTTSFSSTGNANLNTIIDYVFSNSENSILNYFSTMWENLKNTSLYNYLLLIIMGSLIIYFVKAMNR